MNGTLGPPGGDGFVRSYLHFKEISGYKTNRILRPFNKSYKDYVNTDKLMFCVKNSNSFTLRGPSTRHTYTIRNFLMDRTWLTLLGSFSSLLVGASREVKIVTIIRERRYNRFLYDASIFYINEEILSLIDFKCRPKNSTLLFL